MIRPYRIGTLLCVLLSATLVLGGCLWLFDGGGGDTQQYIIGLEVSEAMSMLTMRLEAQGIGILEKFPIIDGILAELTEQQVDWIKRKLNVRFVELDVIHTLPPIIPADEAAIEAMVDEEIGWEIKQVNAVAAWQYTKGRGVTIGVMDTGVDANHEDLRGAVVGGYNGITDSNLGWSDDHGHGTAVAGMIAGRLNGTGIVGVAPRANIYALKGLNKDGSGYTSWLLRCFQKALDEELTAVNCSWGSSQESQAITDAMEQLCRFQGLGVICAAGNSGSSPIGYPAKNPVAVAVAAVDKHGNRASFSSFGYALQLNGVAAPGKNVRLAKMGGGTVVWSGTSFSSPAVAGLVALLKSMKWPTRRWLFEGGSLYTEPTPENPSPANNGATIFLGYGIIDCRESIDRLIDAVGELPRNEMGANQG